jgi:ribosome-binding protein aMBF1 (putative translation factor)
MECSVCGVSRKKVRLLDVISSKGIVKICEACSKAEDMPILRRPTTFQLKESEKKPPGIYDMLSSVRRQKKESFLEFGKKYEKTKTETTLKDVIDKNYEIVVSKEKKPRLDLVDNFHWIIMRTRRLKKLTQEQLAKEISESIAAIKMIEDGILPEDDYRLVNKIEGFLGINLVKDVSKTTPPGPEKSPARIIKFDTETMKDLTISDLKRIKEQTERIGESLEENQEKNSEEADEI